MNNNKSEKLEVNRAPIEKAPHAPDRSPQTDVVPERPPTDQKHDPTAGLQPIDDSDGDNSQNSNL